MPALLVRSVPNDDHLLSLVARRPSTESSASGWSTSLPRYLSQRDLSVGL
jgi:hypothetical protein